MVLQARCAVSGAFTMSLEPLSSRRSGRSSLVVRRRRCAIKSSSKYGTTQSGEYPKSNAGTCSRRGPEYFEPSPIPTHHLSHEVALLRVGLTCYSFTTPSRSLSSRKATNLNGEADLLQSFQKFYLLQTASGRSHTHAFIFSAVRLSPQRDSCSSGKFMNGVVSI